MKLDERKMKVLSAVVRDYVATAEPVSSRTISKKYYLGVSSATIRNELSDLEDLGYLEQPHTSAGRVPSDLGYRLYVDQLMEVRSVESELHALHEGYRRRAEHMESLMHATARVLSEMTSYLSVVSGPSMKMATFRSLYMHLVSAGRALLVLLTDFGLVENAIVEVPPDSNEEDLREVSELLTERLRGTPLDKMVKAVTTELEAELKKYRMVLEQILEIVRGSPRDEADKGIYLDGTLNILSQPEFHDVGKVRLVLSALENEETLARIFESSGKGQVNIAIGGENKIREVQDCSVVWTTFSTQGRIQGVLGVIGPRRMDYPRVVSLVDTMREYLARMLVRSVG